MHFAIAFVVVAYSSKVVIVAIVNHLHHHPQAYQLNGLATTTSRPFIIMADDTKVAVNVAVIEVINCSNASYVRVVITTTASSIHLASSQN